MSVSLRARFPRPEGALKHLVDETPRRPRPLRPLQGLTHLPEDLRFPGDQGVDAAGDPEQVHGGVGVGELVKAGGERRQVDVVLAGQVAAHPVEAVEIAADRVDLGAVAGAQHRGLLDAVLADEPLHHLALGRGGKGELLARLHRGCFVVESEGQQVHGKGGMLFPRRLPAVTRKSPCRRGRAIFSMPRQDDQ